jgi:hypothetical protein
MAAKAAIIVSADMTEAVSPVATITTMRVVMVNAVNAIHRDASLVV